MILVFSVAGAVCMVVCQWFIFFLAPAEAEMGEIQKLFYLHFPLAIWALIYFFMVFAGSVVYLFRGSFAIADFCRACGETGVLCCGLALFTGMIWARKSWGVWWTWDPRLATTLAAFFIYSVYLLIRGLDLPESKKNAAQAVVGIVAFLDVPLVFLSARIFRSIHPAVFASRDGGLPPEMKWIIAACCLSLGLFTYGLVLFRKKQLEMEREIKKALGRL
ncbi:MAG: cytochrome c biogenesis protein CcsA [Desulfovibrio sp.]|nr:cytochrome c biogenesis protein CcsA [Desulfovibrio sp.]